MYYCYLYMPLLPLCITTVYYTVIDNVCILFLGDMPAMLCLETCFLGDMPLTTASSVAGGQDLPRTFPSNLWMKGEEGQAALRRVLLAFSVHNHEVGYCQSMNYIAALLLLAMDRDEEKTFWVLVSLIDDGG